MPGERHPVRLRFGAFDVDLRAGELRKQGLRVRLQEQPFQVLAMLLERPGEVVTREELRSRLWSADTFVDFDHGVNKAVNRIREALGDSATSPRFVETVSRRGYRFIADVAAVEGLRAAEPHRPTDARPAIDLVVAPVTAAPGPRPRRSRGRAGPIALAALVGLENLSGDASQEYFADGMTDELIATLGQVAALRVISRTSVMLYKHARKPLPQIARELNVDAVIEGAVFRSGSQVRITAQLIDARDDRHVWSESYDGDLRDTLTLQHQVARAIAEQTRISLNPRERAALGRRTPVDPQAYEAYLRGRYFWNKRTGDDLRKASEYFNEAIARDPTYAPAFSGLADTYALMGDWEYGVLAPMEALPRARAAAVRALELDTALGEAHTSLAFLLDAFDWDLGAAEAQYRRAVELSPGYATAHHWYAWHLSLLGRNAEALAEMQKAQSLDPLSLIINADYAELLLIARFTDRAIEQSRKTIELNANFALAHNQLGVAYLTSGRRAEAIAELQRAVQLSGASPTCTANLARAFAESGRTSEARQLLEELKQRSHSGYSNATEIATIHAALGDRAEALRWLDRAYAERFNPSALLRPGFDSLRGDRRFEDLERRIGLGR
jgi:TolB-like protein/DNA-binding winged helix-turn-helix (wHTH) protein/Tfp pilus assembly protein PilF